MALQDLDFEEFVQNHLSIKPRDYFKEMFMSNTMWTSTASTSTDPRYARAYARELDERIENLKIRIEKEVIRKKRKPKPKPIYHFDPEELVTK